MELEEGMKIGGKELADWFGIKYSSINNGKVKMDKLKELKEYCDYTINGNKIIIGKVYTDTYVRNRSKIYKAILKDLPRQIENGKPWTCVQMGDYYYYKYKDLYGGLESTYTFNTRKARDETWGKPQKDKNSNIRRVICKMYRGVTPKDNVYELLNEEEIEIKRELSGKYFNFMDEDEQLIAMAMAHTEKAEEVAEYVKDKSQNFLEFAKELSKILNCDWIVTATIINDTTLRVSKKVLENCKMLP